MEWGQCKNYRKLQCISQPFQPEKNLYKTRSYTTGLKSKPLRQSGQPVRYTPLIVTPADCHKQFQLKPVFGDRKFIFLMIIIFITIFFIIVSLIISTISNISIFIRFSSATFSSSVIVYSSINLEIDTE